MKVAIMQPYFLPYVGYFQLIGAVDLFIVYDNIKYTKKGWINRNRFLLHGKDAMFSVPLKSDSDTLDVRDRAVAPVFDADKLLNQLRGAYAKAPHFAAAWPLLERVVRFRSSNLFDFLQHSIVQTCAHLGISTRIVVSSTIDIDHGLKSQDKVLALVRAVGAHTYVNSIGGVDLYSRSTFAENGIDLQFLRPREFIYPQFGDAFVPWLSIIDVLMFNTIDEVRETVSGHYDFV